jgi:hypothetical protein
MNRTFKDKSIRKEGKKGNQAESSFQSSEVPEDMTTLQLLQWTVTDEHSTSVLWTDTWRKQTKPLFPPKC